MKAQSAIIFLLVIFFLGCSKDDGPPTKLSILRREGGWRFGHSDPEPFAPGTLTFLGYYDQLYLCNVEEVYYFKPNGSVIATNTRKCDPTEPDTFSGSYSTTGLNGEVATSMSLKLFGESFEVVEVSEQRLWLIKYLPGYYIDDKNNVVNIDVKFRVYYIPQ